MANPIFNILDIALYLSTAIILWRNLLHRKPPEKTHWTMLAAIFAAVALHALVLHQAIWTPLGLNLAFTTAISLVAWAVTLIYALTCLTRPVDNLGIIILPLAGLTVLFGWLWPGEHLLPHNTPLLQGIHIIVSLLAYSLLSLGAAQGIVILLQEHQLRTSKPGRFVNVLPPVQTMESLMVQMVSVGFLLLTLVLLSGVFFANAFFGKPLVLNHHVVLSLLGWLVFGVFLMLRWRRGLRGRRAVYWVLGGVSLVALGYLGTKFVLEILLQR